VFGEIRTLYMIFSLTLQESEAKVRLVVSYISNAKCYQYQSEGHRCL